MASISIARDDHVTRGVVCAQVVTSVPGARLQAAGVVQVQRCVEGRG